MRVFFWYNFCMKSLSVVFFAGLAATALGVNFPLGTYVYTGSVLDFRHEALTSDAGATIQAVASNGTVLASSRIVDPVESTGVNFVLEVPVSSEASGKSAAIGDSLSLVLVTSGGATNVSTRALPPVSAANAITNLTVVSASATSFPCGDGTVLVADDYLAGIAPFMQAEGKSAYDPAADWDGDGASNYEEYKAGTNPFDPSDRLRITEFRLRDDSTLLRFEYAGGHVYAIDTSASLTNKAWAAASFAVGAPGAAEQQTFWVKGNEYEDIGETAVYLAPASSSPSMFYALRAE